MNMEKHMDRRSAAPRRTFFTGLRRAVTAAGVAEMPAALKGRRWFLTDYCMGSREIRDYLEVEGLISSDVRRTYEEVAATHT
jgi:hypothetical protein